jgi:transposase
MLRELSVAEQRYQAILAVLEDGLTVTEVATKAGVTRQRLHNWLRRYAGGGWRSWPIGRTGRRRARTRWPPRSRPGP